jgi:hypothetical protein
MIAIWPLVFCSILLANALVCSKHDSKVKVSPNAGKRVVYWDKKVLESAKAKTENKNDKSKRVKNFIDPSIGMQFDWSKLVKL